MLLTVGVALGLPALPVRAQDTQQGGDHLDDANQALNDYWRAVAAGEIERDADREAALQRVYDQERRHGDERTRRSGAAQQIDRVGRMMEHEEAGNEIDLERQRLENERLKAQIEREKAQAEATKPPSFWDKALDALLRVGEGMLGNAGNKLVDNLFNPNNDPADDQALIDELTRLQEEYDRLRNERDDANGGLGSIITDPTGQTGYDRDGDGFVDIPIYDDGSSGPYNPTNPGYGDGLPSGGEDGLGGNIITDRNGNYGIDRDGDGLVDIPLTNPNAPLSASGGGPSFGGGMGSGMGSGAGGGDGLAARADGAEGEDGKEETIPGVGGTSGESGSGLAAAGGAGATVKGGALGTEKALATIKGRIIVIPKLEFEDLAGNRKAGAKKGSSDAGWEDEWDDDGWDDAADNGDWGDDWADSGWGDDEWGSAAKGASKGGADAAASKDAAAAELVDQIIRVETVIAEWRKAEKEPKELEDPYGFQDGAMSGYQASGKGDKDPFKEVRDRDGKIDLTKVDLWVIGDDSWREGKEPIRYKVKVAPEVKDFEPTHGGVLVARGVEHEVDVEQRVLDEIKGQVKELELVQVILSAEKPSPGYDQLDPSAEEKGDAGVGGLEEDFDAGW